jgi:hypothetical protein
LPKGREPRPPLLILQPKKDSASRDDKSHAYERTKKPVTSAKGAKGSQLRSIKQVLTGKFFAPLKSSEMESLYSWTVHRGGYAALQNTATATTSSVPGEMNVPSPLRHYQQVPSQTVQTRNENSSPLKDIFIAVKRLFQQNMTELNGHHKIYIKTHEAKWPLEFTGPCNLDK